jgi:hypothetical protein
MNDLVPCPDCERHIRRREASCPFCGASVAEALQGAPVRQLPATRLGRFALYTFAAASIGATACGGDDAEPGPGTGGAGGKSGAGGQNSTGGKQNATGGGDQGGGAVALYGAAPLYGLPASPK